PAHERMRDGLGGYERVLSVTTKQIMFGPYAKSFLEGRAYQRIGGDIVTGRGRGHPYEMVLRSKHGKWKVQQAGYASCHILLNLGFMVRDPASNRKIHDLRMLRVRAGRSHYSVPCWDLRVSTEM